MKIRKLKAYEKLGFNLFNLNAYYKKLPFHLIIQPKRIWMELLKTNWWIKLSMYTLRALKSMACQSKASKSPKSAFKLSFSINVTI